MIITIDGPAGAGKSSISKQFASQINFQILDTGAMYRCVALLQKQNNASLDDLNFQQDIININISFDNGNVFLNGKDVSLDIRTPEMDILTSSVVSVHPFVRKELCNLQRKIAQNQNMVAEGRDMGTNVFPDSPLKFYLTANPLVRAERRHKQLSEKNIIKDIKELEKEIISRDHEDSNRAINPLRIPDNACVIDTSHLTPQEVLDQMLLAYNNKK